MSSLKEFNEYHPDMLQSGMLSIASVEHETYKEIEPAGDEPTDAEFARATHAALSESIRATLEAIEEFEQSPYNEGDSALTESSGCYLNKTVDEVLTIVAEMPHEENAKVVYFLVNGITSMHGNSKAFKLPNGHFTASQIASVANALAEKVDGFVVVFHLGCFTEKSASASAEVSLEKVIHFSTLDQLPSDRVPLLYAVTY